LLVFDEIFTALRIPPCSKKHGCPKEIIGTKNTNNFEILVGAGKAIIQSLHERFERDHQDDTEYIPAVKSVIFGIKQFAITIEFNEMEISTLEETLKNYSRQLYLEVWLSHNEEGEGVDEATEASNYYFDYVYEHEEHPH